MQLRQFVLAASIYTHRVILLNLKPYSWPYFSFILSLTFWSVLFSAQFLVFSLDPILESSSHLWVLNAIQVSFVNSSLEWKIHSPETQCLEGNFRASRLQTGVRPWAGQVMRQSPSLYILFFAPFNLFPFVSSGERPFKCPIEGCGRSFTTSNIRKVHIRTHTGERPYYCTEPGCGRAFASATNYKNHVRIHTGNDCWCLGPVFQGFQLVSSSQFTWWEVDKQLQNFIDEPTYVMVHAFYPSTGKAELEGACNYLSACTCKGLSLILALHK